MITLDILIFVCVTSYYVNAQETSRNCSDFSGDCPTIKQSGLCDKSSPQLNEYLRTCPFSCEVCLPKITDIQCEDTDPICSVLSTQGDCYQNPLLFLQRCPKICQACPPTKPQECIDHHPTCYLGSFLGLCRLNAPFFLSFCAESCRNFIPQCGKLGVASFVEDICKDPNFECGINSKTTKDVSLRPAGVAAIAVQKRSLDSLYDYILEPIHRFIGRIKNDLTLDFLVPGISNLFTSYNSMTSRQDITTLSEICTVAFDPIICLFIDCEGEDEEDAMSIQAYYNYTFNWCNPVRVFAEALFVGGFAASLIPEEDIRVIQPDPVPPVVLPPLPPPPPPPPPPSSQSQSSSSRSSEEIERTFNETLVPFCNASDYNKILEELNKLLNNSVGFPMPPEAVRLALSVNFCQNGIGDPSILPKNIRYRHNPNLLIPPPGWEPLKFPEKRANNINNRPKRQLNIISDKYWFDRIDQKDESPWKPMHSLFINSQNLSTSSQFPRNESLTTFSSPTKLSLNLTSQITEKPINNQSLNSNPFLDNFLLEPIPNLNSNNISVVENMSILDMFIRDILNETTSTSLGITPVVREDINTASIHGVPVLPVTNNRSDFTELEKVNGLIPRQQIFLQSLPNKNRSNTDTPSNVRFSKKQQINITEDINFIESLKNLISEDNFVVQPISKMNPNSNNININLSFPNTEQMNSTEEEDIAFIETLNNLLNITDNSTLEQSLDLEGNSTDITTQNKTTENNTNDDVTQDDDAINDPIIAINEILGPTPVVEALLDKDRGVFACGGSLISPYHIVTAAHCLIAKRRPKKVRLGEVDFSRTDESSAFDYPIRSVEIHQDYQLPRRYNDIAVITLKNKVNFTEDILPFCLPNRTRVFEGTICTVSGWGQRPNERASSILRNLPVEVLNTNECERNYTSPVLGQSNPFKTQFPDGFPDSLICAGKLNDVCRGDSGGPLAYLASLVGVVSLGYGCADPMFPGIYTRVASYLEWLDAIVFGGCSTGTNQTIF